MDPIVARIIDANGNRAREALRVMEDFARFGVNDGVLAGELKGMRHALAGVMEAIGGQQAMLHRDTPGDVGTEIVTESEMRRAGVGDVVVAAGKRLSEALRSLEEFAKTIDGNAAGALEQLRYRGYEMERVLGGIAGQLGGRFAGVRLCVLLTESLCHPAAGGGIGGGDRDQAGWEKVLDAVLAGGRKGGERGEGGGGEGGQNQLCVQLREKNLSDAELLRRARIVVDKCHRAGALAIINDRADVAMAAGADGVHLGQTDLPCAAVRRMVGERMIVGVSTENLEQAQRAVREGASYVAVGPMFPTTTKEKPRLAGPTYAREAVREISLPVIAIGGITVENVGQLTAVGVKAVAVCGAVIGVGDARGAVERFLKRMLD